MKWYTYKQITIQGVDNMLIGIINGEVFKITQNNHQAQTDEYTIESTGKTIEEALADYFNDGIKKIVKIKKASYSDAIDYVKEVMPVSYSNLISLRDSLNAENNLDIEHFFWDTPSFWKKVFEITPKEQWDNLFCVVEKAILLFNLNLLEKIAYRSYMVSELYAYQIDSNTGLDQTASDKFYNTILSQIEPVEYSLKYIQNRLIKIYEADSFHVVTLLLSELIQTHEKKRIIDICPVCNRMFVCKGRRTCSTQCSQKHYAKVRLKDSFYKMVRNYNNRLANAATYLTSASTETQAEATLRQQFFEKRYEWDNLVADLKADRKKRGLSREITDVGPMPKTMDKIDYSFGEDIYQLGQIWEKLDLETLCEKIKKLNMKRRIKK